MNIHNNSVVVHDDNQKPLLLEWQEIKGGTDELDNRIKELISVLVPSYTQTEFLFAQKNPEKISTDFMLKYLAYLFDKPNLDVDWQLIEQKIAEHLTSFFSSFDWKKSSGKQDKHIFVTAKDPETQQVIGCLQFMQTPEYEDETFKAALYGVLPEQQSRGIEKLLMASIFHIRPETKRIFLHTRSSNEHLIDLYKSWGFTEFDGPLAGWTDLEYFADKSKDLQQRI